MNNSASVKYLYLLLFFCIAINWLMPLSTSLWLDETVTFWAIKDGFGQMLNRTTELHYFSLFFCVDWLMAKIGAANEIMLRLPSVFSMLAALAVLYRITCELFDEETAVYAMLLFASHPAICTQAYNARPYALGLLLVVVGMLYFIRYLKAECFRDGILFAFFSGLAVYTHPFFGLLLLSCGAATAIRLLNGKVSNRIHMLTIWGSLFFFLLPAAWVYAPLLDRSHSLVYVSTPSYADFFQLLVPKQFVIALIFCLIAGIILRVRLVPLPVKQWKPAILLACWVLVPSLTLFLISRFSTIKIFQDYYLITIVPGVVLFLAAFIRSCEAKPGTRHYSYFGRRINRLSVKTVLITIIVSVTLVNSVVCKTWTSVEDWRYAIQTAQSYLDNNGAPIPVFLASGLIESNQIEWLSDPVKASYLLAPLAVYPLNGTVFPLPFSMEEEIFKLYSLNLLNHTSGNQCMLIGRRSNNEFGMEKAFRALAEKSGYKKRYLYCEDGLFVMIFKR